jgi:hypothetical protein
VEIDEAVIALRALVGHPNDLVKTRTHTINRCTCYSPSASRPGHPPA